MLLMHFLENKVAAELTRSEFVEAQEVHFVRHLILSPFFYWFVRYCLILQALLQMKKWFIRFPTILQGCESVIEMLRGQYAHSLGCFNEAIFHFIEAVKVCYLYWYIY